MTWKCGNFLIQFWHKKRWELKGAIYQPLALEVCFKVDGRLERQRIFMF